MTTPGKNSDDKSSCFNNNGTLALFQNSSAAVASREPSLMTPGENSNDEWTGFENRVRTRDVLLNIGAADPSCELSLSTLGANSNDRSSGFKNGVRTQNFLQHSGAMAASHEPSSTTRRGKRKRGPCLELTLAPPGIKIPKKKFCKSQLPPLPNPPLDLPRDFREHIDSLHGQEVKLVMQKVLTCSDLSSHLARLLLPENQIMRGVTFLRTGECDKLHTSKDKGISVGVISSKLEEKSLKFKLWWMRKKAKGVGHPEPEPTKVYALQGGWVGFAREYKLKENDRVQLWSFRVSDKTHQDSLKFAIVKLKDNDKDRGGHYTEAVIHPERSRTMQRSVGRNKK